MNYRAIVLEKRENIVIITLNRPEKLNAINPQMNQELSAALDDVEKDDDIRVVVITGAGRAFCSGGDVEEMSGEIEEVQRWSSSPTGAVMKIHKMQKPTIAMVNGIAAGGGSNLALACDLRVGSENAKFLNAFIRRGLTPGAIGTWLYPRVMGLGKALEYLFTGDFMEAKEAEKLGVLNRLVPADELEKETMSLARRIASGPPIAIGLTKRQVYDGLGVDLETALQKSASYDSLVFSSEDRREGIAAFREKRRGKFRGR